MISLEVDTFKGGFDEGAKRALYARFTDAIRRRAGMPAPGVSIVLREIEPID